MQITTTARHFELTPALKEHIEEKMHGLKRYFDQLLSGHVTLSVQKHEHVAEISIHANNADFIVQGKSEDMYVSVDRAVEKAERQIKRHKEKLRRRKGQVPLNAGLVETAGEDEDAEEA